MRLIIAAALVLLCSGASAKDLSSLQKSKIEAAVKERLVDADSAKFKFPKYSGGSVYCGQVNAKNRMGGYAGFAVFQTMILSSSSIMLLGVGSSDPNDSSTSALLTTCREAGYSL
ncbi:hypothetical protein [Pseudomonas putida]|uniref:hypothetical protein n=1 Tax=Pseudomonas putida TaxID=303 RepID=UPI00066A365B|nr:hypothetical protein [Pseudomonas putida]